jgi:hypothetical protein
LYSESSSLYELGLGELELDVEVEVEVEGPWWGEVDTPPHSTLSSMQSNRDADDDDDEAAELEPWCRRSFR